MTIYIELIPYVELQAIETQLVFRARFQYKCISLTVYVSVFLEMTVNSST